MFKKLSFILITLSVSGCGASLSLSQRHAIANDIALTSSMVERAIPAGMFNLTSFEHVPKNAAPVDLYIEGDGLAWLDAHTKSMNPTPPDPTALRLAAADKNINVVYLARPCQYTGTMSGDACDDMYWTEGRTAPEVVQAYQRALDNIKLRYNVTGFNLIGYSGGAGVAALVAADRTDVLSLRTVAGNTDYTAFANFHGVSPMSSSVNPTTVAIKLAHLPQMHFIGSDDKIVPQVIFEGWKRASDATACVNSTVVPGATHEKGWAERWPELLAMPVKCEEAAPESGKL